MLVIDPSALYSLDDLREMLHGIVELDTFLERLGLRNKRMFRYALWGFEILEAARNAKSFSEASRPGGEVTVIAKGRNSGRALNSDNSPVRKLSSSDLCD